MPKYLVSNNHPAIIDRDTFKQVQSEMAKRRSRPRVSDKTITAKGKFSGKYPFSDLLVCDSCGNRYRRCMWISGGKKKSCGVVLRESSMEGKRASLYLLVMN